MIPGARIGFTADSLTKGYWARAIPPSPSSEDTHFGCSELVLDSTTRMDRKLET